MTRFEIRPDPLEREEDRLARIDDLADLRIEELEELDRLLEKAPRLPSLLPLGAGWKF